MGDIFSRGDGIAEECDQDRPRPNPENSKAIRLMNYLKNGGRIPKGFGRRQLAALRKGEEREWKAYLGSSGIEKGLKDHLIDLAESEFPNLRPRMVGPLRAV